MVETHESSLLLTLEEISRLISHCRKPQQTLTNVVRLLQQRFGTEVCSVYLLEPRNRELVLAETVGLHPDAVGQVRMRLDEGLTGLVAQQAGPVVVKEASTHPRFKYFPEAGEDRYHSFLGVPLLEAGQVTGVLVLQTVQVRDYSASEVRMLVTAAAQLSPLVCEAWMLTQVEGAHGKEAAAAATAEGQQLTGTSLSPGVGIGAAYWSQRFDWDLLAKSAGTFEQEQQRLRAAMELARQETERLAQRLADLLGEDQGGILQAQVLILQDAKIEEDLTSFLSLGASAEAAVLRCVEKYNRLFQQIANAYFRERLYDIKDVFRRILWQLQPGTADTGSQSQRLILVGEDASVAELFAVELERLAAIVVEQGGQTSHAAILARSLGIPMVAQVPNLLATVRAGAQLLVDGHRGLVYLQPAERLLAEYREKQTGRVIVREPEAASVARAAVRPGPILEANINLVAEVGRALADGATGVGLYRTEFLVLSHRAIIGEEQQVRNYRQLLTRLDGRSATIRTFDLRAEKAPPRSADQPDPGCLDWRLVLRSAAVQRVFRQQVRAILRAGVAGPVRILVPLVVSTEQLTWIKQAIIEAQDELRREGLEMASNVPVGIMIEAPVAATMVEDWASQVDFLCLGTNDLLASSMGVSRDDPVAEIVCDPLHPGLVRTVRHVINAAHAASRKVTVCGEMAVTERGVRLLAEMGADALSVAVNHVARVRRSLEDWTTAPAD